jgi:spore coat protein CotH
MTSNRIIQLVFVLFWVLVFSFTSFAQTSDDLFDGAILHEIRIYIAPQDYATFHQTNFICRDQELAALAGAQISELPRIICDFAVEFHWKFQGRDITTPEVAIKSHGKGSRSNIKPSFKIEFNHYESQNLFLGLRSIVLRANTQDASQMHERVAMAFFRMMGIPAPREAHTRLYINDQYAGLYTIVEEVDPIFIQRQFGEINGYLYSYEWPFTWVFQYLGAEASKYSPLPFKPENNEDHFDPGPIEAMVRTINQAPDSQLSTALSQYIDLNALFREIGAEDFIAEQDAIIGDYGINNLYLYRFENTLRSIFLPWDKSNTFWAINRDIFHNWATNVLTRRALAVAPDLVAIYKTTMSHGADVAGGPGGWLEQEITNEYQQIRQSVYDDQLKLCDEGATGTLHPCSNAEFETESAYMIQFARQRSDFVRAELAASPQ